jgi:hypothetical protein
MSTFEKATLRWAKTAVIMSGLAALFVSAQWYEMHEGGKDTHELARAAGNQATWAERLAGSAATQETDIQKLATQAKIQADRTKDLADRMKDQADQTKIIANQATIQANAAKSAADTSKQEMELSQRPWLIVKAAVAGPLTYDRDGGHITLHYAIVNVGHSPATAVNIWPEFYIANGKKPLALVEQRRLCTQQVPTGTRIGETIFPGSSPFEVNELFSMSRSDIDDSLRYFGGKFFVASIVDCVTYHASFGKQAYYVGSSYELGRPNPNGGVIAFAPYVDMPFGSLVLEPEPPTPVEAN